MPNPLPSDIRAGFEVLFAEGLTNREIGRRFMISAASTSRLSQKLRQGLRLSPAEKAEPHEALPKLVQDAYTLLGPDWRETAKDRPKPGITRRRSC